MTSMLLQAEPKIKYEINLNCWSVCWKMYVFPDMNKQWLTWQSLRYTKVKYTKVSLRFMQIFRALFPHRTLFSIPIFWNEQLVSRWICESGAQYNPHIRPPVQRSKRSIVHFQPDNQLKHGQWGGNGAVTGPRSSLTPPASARIRGICCPCGFLCFPNQGFPLIWPPRSHGAGHPQRDWLSRVFISFLCTSTVCLPLWRN